MPSFPPLPNEIKQIAHFLKVADEHEGRNMVVAYWSRMYACQVAMKVVPGKKPPEVSTMLLAIMDWLEQTKKENATVDGITNETCAQALIEEYALQLFNYADSQDKASQFGKNMVKAFYTSGILMDILQQFGPLEEDMAEQRRYAKWKAAYIHNCLKNGEQPMPGPLKEDYDNLEPNNDEAPEEDEDKPDLPPLNMPSNPSPPANDADGMAPPSNPVEPLLPVPGLGSLDLPSVPPSPQVFPTFPSATLPPTTLPVPDPSLVQLAPEQIEKAQKYCKWAGSALTYDDVTTAIDNLQKALHLLQFGQEK